MTCLRPKLTLSDGSREIYKGLLERKDPWSSLGYHHDQTLCGSGKGDRRIDSQSADLS